MKYLKTCWPAKNFLCAILIICILFYQITPALAYNSQETSSAFYVQTRDCPSDIINYAVENASRFVMAMNEQREFDYDEIYIGQPFTYGSAIPHLFTFPIFKGDHVIYTLRVAHDENNNISGTCSLFLVDALNEYIDKTTYQTPLTLKIEDYQLIACVGDSQTVVTTFFDSQRMGIDLNGQENYSKQSLITVDINRPLNQNLSWKSTRDPFRYIDLTIVEHQSFNNWCAAYVTTTIIRTLKGSALEPRAQTMMTWYALTSYADAPSFEQCTDYAIQSGFPNAKFTSDGLSDYELFSQIDAGMPVFYTIYCSSIKSAHAVALRGYSIGSSTWSIWNPHDTYYESFPMNGTYMTSDGCIYKYSGRNVYDFC